MPCFAVYGLHVQADVDVPGLWACPDGQTCTTDVEVVFAPQAATQRRVTGTWEPHPRWRDIRDFGTEVPAVRLELDVTTGDVGLRYYDDSVFMLERTGAKVHVLAPPGMSTASVSTYLVNGVLALVLRLRGVTSLHAATVATADGGICFAGPSGAGKSTLMWGLARRGYRVLTDDVSVLDVAEGREPRVRSGYPRVRLWPRTVRGLLGDEEALPLVSDDWDKRWAVLDDFEPTATPLRALCLLDGAASRVEVERLAGPQAVVALMGNVYLDYMLDAAARAHDFDLLAGLVTTVPVLRVRRPRDLDRLETIAEEIMSAVRPAMTAGSVSTLRAS